MARHRLSGRLVSGKGEGAYFTRTDWARAAFRDLVAIDPWPGTLNLQVIEAESLAVWRAIREAPGLLLEAPNPDWCDGRCYPTLIEERIEAAIVLPEVLDYAHDQIEIIAAVGLRDALGVTDGAVLRIEVTA